MSDTPENPPAFPVIPPGQDWYEGMALRDYFAGQALVALLSTLARPYTGHGGPYENRRYAEGAYLIADAMLKERTK